MLQAIQIQNFRGISQGSVENFCQLTVLVGPNNSGKTSTLEALQIISNGYAGFGEVATKMRGKYQPHTTPRSLSYRNGGLRLIAKEDDRFYTCIIEESLTIPELTAAANSSKLGPGRRSFLMTYGGSDSKGVIPRPNTTRIHVMFDENGESAAYRTQVGISRATEAEFLGANHGASQSELIQSYSHLATRGRAEMSRAIELMKTADSSLLDIRVAIAHSDVELNLVYESRSVPALVSGDGQKRLLSMAAAAALRPPLLLLEEPERALDPNAMRAVASLIASIASDGTQVIMTTHSPELWNLISANYEDARAIWLTRDDAGKLTSENLTHDQHLLSKMRGQSLQ